MGIKIVQHEGLGYAAILDGESYLQLDHDYATIESMLRRADAEVLEEKFAKAFLAKSDTRWEERRVAYQKENQRKNPRSYRVKLTLEIEQATDDDADKFLERASSRHDDYAGDGSSD